VIAFASFEICGPLTAAGSLDHIPNAGLDASDFKVMPVTSIISKIEGTINTAVGKIKQNDDGHSFNKEGGEQEELGKRQLNNGSEKHNVEKDG